MSGQALTHLTARGVGEIGWWQSGSYQGPRT